MQKTESGSRQIHSAGSLSYGVLALHYEEPWGADRQKVPKVKRIRNILYRIGIRDRLSMGYQWLITRDFDCWDVRNNFH